MKLFWKSLTEALGSSKALSKSINQRILAYHTLGAEPL
jgi:hypothetical protein